MPKIARTLSLIGSLLLAQPAAAASLSLTATRAVGEGFVAEGVTASYAPQGAFDLSATRLKLAGTAAANKLSVHCATLRVTGGKAGCAQGSIDAATPAGPLGGSFSFAATDQREATFKLVSSLGSHAVNADLAVSKEAAKLHAQLEKFDLATLLKIPALAALLPKGVTATGSISLQLDAEARSDAQTLKATVSSASLTATEASGRFASDKLDLAANIDASRASTWLAAKPGPLAATAEVKLTSGQLYLEPVFSDFGVAAMQAAASLHYLPGTRQIKLDNFSASQHSTFVASGSGALQLSPFVIESLDAKLTEAQLPDFYDRYVVPFLAGKPGEDTKTTGSASGSLQILGGKTTRAQLTLKGVGAEAKRLDAGLNGVSGTLAWTPAAAPAEASSLVWQGGHIGKLQLPGASLKAEARGDGLRLLAPLRQAVLGGALRVDELTLAKLQSPSPTAQVKAEVEPIDLKALTVAMGWPEFSGQLGGKLPGLSFADNTLALEGALTAQVFDGDITIDNLRWIEPMARSRRLTADISLKRVDLTQLTGAFSYGRIDGRVDGEIKGLKLLGFKPVAFDARVYTSQKNPGKRRISQRAINNISSLGGGPSALLSKSVLRFFKDFAYSRLGFSCLLKDNVCQMGGIGPAKDGGYVLVEGSLLPRIDVVGHSTRVDWETFYAQLLSLRDLQAPKTGVEVGK